MAITYVGEAARFQELAPTYTNYTIEKRLVGNIALKAGDLIALYVASDTFNGIGLELPNLYDRNNALASYTSLESLSVTLFDDGVYTTDFPPGTFGPSSVIGYMFPYSIDAALQTNWYLDLIIDNVPVTEGAGYAWGGCVLVFRNVNGSTDVKDYYQKCPWKIIHRRPTLADTVDIKTAPSGASFSDWPQPPIGSDILVYNAKNLVSTITSNPTILGNQPNTKSKQELILGMAITGMKWNSQPIITTTLPDPHTNPAHSSPCQPLAFLGNSCTSCFTPSITNADFHDSSSVGATGVNCNTTAPVSVPGVYYKWYFGCEQYSKISGPVSGSVIGHDAEGRRWVIGYIPGNEVYPLAVQATFGGVASPGANGYGYSVPGNLSYIRKQMERKMIPFYKITSGIAPYNFGVSLGDTVYSNMGYISYGASSNSPPIMDAKKDRNEQLITIWDDNALVPFGYNTERTELEVYTQPPATTQSFFTSARSGTISVKQWGYTNGYWISTIDDSLQGNFNDPFFGRAGAFIFLPQSPKKMNTVHANYDHIFRWDYLVSTAKTSDSLNNTLWFARNLGGDSWYKFNNGNVWKQIFNSTSGSPVAVTGQFANTTLKEAIIVLRYIDMGGAMKQLFSKDMGETWDDNWQFTEPYDGVPNHAPDLGIGNVKNFCVFFDYVTRITYITGVFDDGGDVGKIFFARHLGGKDFFNFNNGNFVKTLPSNIQAKVASTLSKNGSLVLKYVDKDGNLKKLISDNHGEIWKDTWYVGPSGIGL